MWLLCFSVKKNVRHTLDNFNAIFYALIHVWKGCLRKINKGEYLGKNRALVLYQQQHIPLTLGIRR